mgnify:CR=1 FL=1|tara:strand:- start:117 stop:794 length:678 start_codon:yes stop_codon:yes gene_type:complete
MSNFKDCPKFSTHDDFYTPKYAWGQIQNIINKDFRSENKPLKVFECFSYKSNEQSIKHLTDLGYNVIGNKKIDYLDNNTWNQEMINGDYDLVLSNPPFQKISSFKRRHESLKYQCIEKLIRVDKPFIILMNSTNIFSKWFQFLIKNCQTDIKFIYPTSKINYDKYEEGGVNKIISKSQYLKSLKKKVKQLTPEEKQIYDNKETLKSAAFNSVYVCYKSIKTNHWI